VYLALTVQSDMPRTARSEDIGCVACILQKILGFDCAAGVVKQSSGHLHANSNKGFTLPREVAEANVAVCDDSRSHMDSQLGCAF